MQDTLISVHDRTRSTGNVTFSKECASIYNHCGACVGKALGTHKPTLRTRRIGEKFSSDTSRPLTPTSTHRKDHFMTFIDAGSRFLMVIFLKSRGEVGSIPPKPLNIVMFSVSATHFPNRQCFGVLLWLCKRPILTDWYQPFHNNSTPATRELSD